MLSVTWMMQAACNSDSYAGALLTVPEGGKLMEQPVPVDQPGPPVSRERSPALDLALSANSSAALIMFLIDNPLDPFADAARTYLKARRIPDSAMAIKKAAGDKANIVAEFDAARLDGGESGWAEFLKNYPHHPLAAEVPRFR